jgi:spore germination protein KA
MFKKRLPKQLKHYDTPQAKTLVEVFDKAKKSSDFTTIYPGEDKDFIQISFYKTLINLNVLHRSLLPYLMEKRGEIKDLADVKNIVPLEDILNLHPF